MAVLGTLYSYNSSPGYPAPTFLVTHRVTLLSQNTVTNTSVVNFRCVIYFSGEILVNAGGTTTENYVSTTRTIPYLGSYYEGNPQSHVIVDHNITIYHNADGTATGLQFGSAINGFVFMSVSGGGSEQSGSWYGYYNLPRILRYASYLNSSPYCEYPTSTTINVAVCTDVTCDRLQLSIDGGSWANYYTGDFTGWKSVKVIGFAPGTKHSFRTSVKRKDSQLWKESGIFYGTTLNKPTVSSGSISSIATTSATASGNVSSDGGSGITQRGFVYSTSSNPTTSNSKKTVSGTTGSMSASITGLSTNTTYYVRAFATNEVGTSYGANLSFKTLGLASVSTSSASNIALSSATLNGSLAYAGNPTITQKGFVYATTSSPTTSSNKIIVSGSSTGSYSSNLTGLNANTTYYVRSYAINSVGTVYGANVSFKTLRQPSVSTSAATNVYGATAKFNGNLLDAGNPTITQKGFVYSTSSSPTTSNTKAIVSGTSLGAYYANISGLSSGTRYYVRSYAINSTGTVYGSQIYFDSSKITGVTGNLTFSGVVDADIRMYRSISGTLLFSGHISSIKIFDPAFIDQKTYLYKIYDEDGTFLEVIDDVVSDIEWSEEINQIGSSVTIELARNTQSSIQKSAPILDSDGASIKDNNGINIMGVSGSLKKVGSTSSLQLNNRVDIFVYYGIQEPILDNNGVPILDSSSDRIDSTVGAPNGTRKFTGFISEINIGYGASENTEITLMSYGFDLEQYLLVDGDGNTTVTFNSTDPADMIRTGITQFDSDGLNTYVTYLGGTVSDTSTSASYTFRANTYKELLDKAVQLSPVGWFYRIDLGTNLIYFNKKSDIPHHYFYLGKHIKGLNVVSYIGGIINDVLFTGGGDPALFRRKTITPVSHTRRGLDRQSDSRVELNASADLLSSSIIDENKNIQYKTTVEIIDKTYDIESINVGDIVGFRNFNNEIDLIVMQIVRKTYTADIAYLQLDTLPKSVPKRVEELRKALNTTDNTFVPGTPDSV